MCICPIPTVTDIVTLSLVFGHFHPIFEAYIISPLHKKSALDKDHLSNCHPIFNLSVVSKIIEHVVKSHLMDHLTSNYLILTILPAVNTIPPKWMSCIFMIISSMQNDHRKYRVFAFLTSAAFYTTDHNILVTRLSSWLHIHHSVLSLFTSYLPSCSFHVKCDSNLSFCIPPPVVSPRLVLGPLLLALYTTILSTLTFLSLNYHLYAGDTQLLSLHPPTFTHILLSHYTVVWGYLVYCVFVCLFFVCTVTDFLAVEKMGVKFCMRVLTTIRTGLLPFW